MFDFVNLVNHGGKHSTPKADWETSCEAFKENLIKQVGNTGADFPGTEHIGLPVMCPSHKGEDKAKALWQRWAYNLEGSKWGSKV